MSTTVSYKGNTIATLANETKKLTTSGTWLEDDITITDAPADILVIDTILSNGGTHREISTTHGNVNLQSSITINTSTSPQIVSADSGYDGFAGGMTLTVTGTLITHGVTGYVGNYVEGSPTVTKGKLIKSSRKIFGL